MDGRLPEEQGTPPFITFKSEIANAIGDCRRALIQRGSATREMETLRAMLYPWAKDDEQFREAVEGLESEMLKARSRHNWARPVRSWWQSRYFGLLLGLAKHHRLLDIEAIIHLDEGEL